jgi:hypothetical protein
MGRSILLWMLGVPSLQLRPERFEASPQSLRANHSSRSKPLVRTSATYLSAGRTGGSCLGRRTSVACEDRTNLRIALSLARGAAANPAAHKRTGQRISRI